MTLKLFAHSESAQDESTRLDALTIAGGPEELRLLANFLAQSADEIEAHGPHVSHRCFSSEPGVKRYPGILPEVYVSQCV